PSRLHPPQHPLAPGVEQAQRQDGDEDDHLDQPEDLQGLEPDGPGEDEHRLDVEHDEQQREDVVADLALRPARPDGVDPALVVEVLLRLGPGGTQQAPDSQHGPDHEHGCTREDRDGEVLAEELRHRPRLVIAFTGRQNPSPRSTSPRVQSRSRVASRANSMTTEGRKPTTRVNASVTASAAPAARGTRIGSAGGSSAVAASRPMYMTTITRR